GALDQRGGVHDPDPDPGVPPVGTARRAGAREGVTMVNGRSRPRWLRADVIFFAIAVLIPQIDAVVPGAWQIGRDMRPIFLFAILGLGLTIVTGFAALLPS